MPTNKCSKSRKTMAFLALDASRKSPIYVILLCYYSVTG